MDPWQRNAKSQRKNEILESATSTTKQDTLPKIAKQNRK